jgi:lysophospholipase L1-like esterase
LAHVLEVEFLYASSVVDVFNVGDSISYGSGSATLGASYVAQSVWALSTPSQPVTHDCSAIPSTNTTSFLTRLTDNFAAGARPGIVVIAQSTNDGVPTPAVMDKMFANTLAMLTLCRQYGAVPIVTTYMPNNDLNFNSTQDGLRKAHNTRLLALRNSGVLVADIATPLDDGATPARFISAFTTDGRHPNAAGYVAAKAPMQVQLATAIAQIRGTLTA